MLLETVSGKFIDPSDVNPDQIDINDIAWALSRINRFSGHTTTAIPYNVAQHCVFVADIIQESYCGKDGHYIAMYGLLHDSAEIFVGDIPSPSKHIPELRAIIDPIEQKILDVINVKFCKRLPTVEEWKIVKYFDKKAQFIEAWNFMASRGANWPGRDQYDISLIDIQEFPSPQSSIESYKNFINKFNELKFD